MMFCRRKLGFFVLVFGVWVLSLYSLDGTINLASRKFGFRKVRDFLGKFAIEKMQNLQTNDAFELWKTCFKDFEIYERLSHKRNLQGILFLCAIGTNQLNSKNYHNLIPVIYQHIEIFCKRENRAALTKQQKKLYIWNLETLAHYTASFFQSWGDFLFGTPPSITPDVPKKIPLPRPIPDKTRSCPGTLLSNPTPTFDRSNTAPPQRN